MSDLGSKRVSSALGAEELIGRERELGTLREFASAASGEALLVSAAPWTGASDLLRSFCAELFAENGAAVPVYFRFRGSDRTIEAAASRFIHEFLVQLIAYRRREPALIKAHPGLDEIAALAPAADETWIRELLLSSTTGEGSGFVAKAFGVPQRSSLSGSPCVVIFDGLENSLLLKGGSGICGLLRRIYEKGSANAIISGSRKFIRDETNSGRLSSRSGSPLNVDPLGFGPAGSLVNSMVKSSVGKVPDQARDLLVTLLESRTDLIEAFFEAAVAEGAPLRNFREVLTFYFRSLIGGRLGGVFDSALAAVASAGKQTEILDLFASMIEGARDRTPAAAWTSRLRSSEGLRFLEAIELVKVDANGVSPGESGILRDYVVARSRIELSGENEAIVLADGLRHGLKSAAGVMSTRYRQEGLAGVAEILSKFDCQEVPTALLDYGLFKEKYKGGDLARILADPEGASVLLPEVFHSDAASEFYPPINDLLEKDRVAVAFAFEGGNYRDDTEVAWVAAEIESKLEADEETVSFWCDRLEMIAVANDISSFRLWLISPEGFTAAALEILAQRGAYGSSAVQAKLLGRFLDSGGIEPPPAGEENFSFEIPMGEDTELIAAHAVEEIARKSRFGTSDINQIKTALVEACINATEHSHSPDRKISIEVKAAEGRLKLTVSNRGVLFSESESETSARAEERRGWGLKLIRSLMDEVRFERSDEGARIVMVKLQPKAAAKAV